MANIILFKNIVETQEFFEIMMAKHFASEGNRVFFVDDEQDVLEQEILDIVKNDSLNTYAISFNYHGLQIVDDKGDNVWEKYNLPFICIAVDHPVYGASFLQNVPDSYIHISIDEGHDKYMKRFYPNIKCGPVLYLAGTKLETAYSLLDEACFMDGTESKIYVPMKDRSDEIFFCGNFIPDENLEYYVRNLDKEYKDFYKEIVDYLEANPSKQFDDTALDFVMKQIDGQPLNDSELVPIMTNMMYVDIAIRNRIRGKVVSTIADAGIRLHVMGKNWEKLDCTKRENVRITQFGDSIKCLELINKSKITLNVLPWFKFGPHDRVFNTMLNRGVCVTDTSKMLENELVDGENALIYHLDKIYELPEKIENIVDDIEKLEYISQCGYKYASASHTWEHRADKLLKYIATIER